MVLAEAPTRPFTGWFAYRAIRYELRSIPACFGGQFGGRVAR
jgi:hypothetical protein